MSEQYGQKSVVQIEEEQAGEQLRLKVAQSIRRMGAQDPEGVVEYLSQFKAAKQLLENQQDFLAKVKAIRSNVDLSAEERLEAGRGAAQEAQNRHAELVDELRRQADARLEKLNKTLFHTTDTTTLHALADLDESQLDTRAEIARNASDMDLLRAVRVVAASKGFESLITKAAALDEDTAVSAAYVERQQLQTSGALQALSGAYLPPPVREQQLQPTTAEVEHAERVRESERASGRRILEGQPGILDTDYTRGPARQIGRKRT